MRENHLLLFRRLDRAVWGETLAEAERASESVAQKLRREQLTRLPGEVSFAKVDLTTLLVYGLPAEYLAENPNADKNLLKQEKLFGRYGTVRKVELLAGTASRKHTTFLKVFYTSPLEAALALLVLYSHLGAAHAPVPRGRSRSLLRLRGGAEEELQALRRTSRAKSFYRLAGR